MLSAEAVKYSVVFHTGYKVISAFSNATSVTASAAPGVTAQPMHSLTVPSLRSHSG